SLGFGVVNWPLGKVFMGDGGAYLLGFLVAWVAILLPMRHGDINGWATLMACAYPVIEALYSIARRHKVPGRHFGQPDKRHLHHFLHRRVVRRFFPATDRTLQNAVAGALVWFLALIPAAWAVANFHNTPALVVGFLMASFGYAALYARLTQFVWCFRPATLQRRSITAT
ncbi:MAG: glycosyl transferase, partial [Burkholderiaceae bacterium]